MLIIILTPTNMPFLSPQCRPYIVKYLCLWSMFLLVVADDISDLQQKEYNLCMSNSVGQTQPCLYLQSSKALKYT